MKRSSAREDLYWDNVRVSLANRSSASVDDGADLRNCGLTPLLFFRPLSSLEALLMDTVESNARANGDLTQPSVRAT
jgi:hypothetical protein